MENWTSIVMFKGTLLSNPDRQESIKISIALLGGTLVFHYNSSSDVKTWHGLDYVNLVLEYYFAKGLLIKVGQDLF